MPRYQEYIKTTPYQKARDMAERELSNQKSGATCMPATDEDDMLATRARRGMGGRPRDVRYTDPQSIYGSNTPALEGKRREIVQPLIARTDSILVAGGNPKTLISHIKKKKKKMG